MTRRFFWLLTALLTAGICVPAIWRGFELTSYAMADHYAHSVLPWISTPGLSFRAREYALTSTDNSNDGATIRKRRDELVDMLAVRPLSSYYWLQLAESRVDMKEPSAQQSAAFDLSVLTGPNEGSMMTQRGMFGIWQWQTLPTESRKRALSDLAARRIPDSKLAWLRKNLSEKTEQVRQEIRSGLEARGLPEPEFVRIGL